MNEMASFMETLLSDTGLGIDFRRDDAISQGYDAFRHSGNIHAMSCDEQCKRALLPD